MATDKHTTAAMVVVGNEILSGKVLDSNSAFLAKELRTAGVSLERIVVIPDEVELIAAEVSECSKRYDLVFTSGGVGPTHDDVTIAGVAAAFGLGLVTNQKLKAAISRVVGDRTDSPLFKMAEIPDGAEVVGGDEEHFPTVVVENVYVLPGIPELFEMKIRNLSDEFKSDPYHLRQVLVSASEGLIAEYLNATLAAFPELMLGSYPKLANAEYRVRLTLESKDEEYLNRALEDLILRMPDEYIVRVER